MAAPVEISEKEIKGDVSLTIFSDNSTSFSLFDEAIVGKLKSELEKEIPVNLVTIASGERSALGDGILNNIRQDQSILIVSDGNNNEGRNLGDIMVFANNLNATINSVELVPQKSDTIVRIEGPSEEIIGSEAAFVVYVDQVGQSQEYSLKVDIDGNLLLAQVGIGSNKYEIKQTLGEGYHKMTAKVDIGDYFQQNDIYYKSISIIPKPSILLVSNKPSVLEPELIKVYDVTTASTIPDNIGKYSAVILNDMSVSKMGDEGMQELIDYVTEGNGLIVLGGDNAYASGDYQDTTFETLLPVKSGEADPESGKDVNIIIVIDISQSTGGAFSRGGDTKADVEKALALSILDTIKEEDKVGVVAFNNEAYVISALNSLSSKPEIRDTITRLKDGGGTDITKGILMAKKMLANAKGSKNIILISDGLTMDPGASLREVVAAERLGIKTYTVGVGQDTYEFFMKEASRLGGGIYFRPEQSERLKILFGEPEEDDKEKKALVILNNNHFITEDLTLTGELTGHNSVVPKSSGRVVTWATDDGSKYAASMLKEENSKIITRAINWAIGNPARSQKFSVLTKDTNIGGATDIFVLSEQKPVSQQLEFNKVDENLYKATFTPNQTGFYDVIGASVAVNYNKEYEQLGLNPQLKNLVTITGGETFKQSDVEKIIEKVKSRSKRTETRNISYRWPLAMAALILFLLEIFIRRIRENSKTHN